MAREGNNRAMVAALMLIAGGIIGAGAAILYAPQSGEKTRRDLCRLGKRARRKGEEAMEVVEDFSENVAEMVESVGDRASEILEMGKDMAYGAKKKVLKVIEEGEERLEKQRARLSKLIG